MLASWGRWRDRGGVSGGVFHRLRAPWPRLIVGGPVGAVMLLLGLALGAVFAACDRGERPKGPSWFDIPHDVNRAARRGR